MALRWAGEQFSVVRGLDAAGWVRELSVLDSLPTPSASYRGYLIQVKAGAGQADALYLCRKLADESYEWVQVI